MASYEQISKGNWKATVSLGYEAGKQIKTRKQGFKTKKDAEKWVTDTLSKKHKGYVFSNESNILLKDFIQKWFYEYKINTLSINTINGYKIRINRHIIPKLGDYKLNKITNMVIQNFYNSLINEGQKPSSAKRIMDTLGTCFKYAQKNKLIYTLPLDIERVPIEPTKINFWTQNELNSFLNYVENTYLYTPVLLDVLTGLRIGELCGLRWCDVDLKNKSLNVRNQIIYDTSSHDLVFTDKLKTSTSYRKITLPNVLINYLNSIKGNSLDTDFIVLGCNGFMCNPHTLTQNFTNALLRYNNSLKDNFTLLRQISFHGLRHTHATLLIFKGENIKVVSERLGHKDITITLNTYTHIMDDMKNNTADLLDDIFTNTNPQ